MAKVIYKCTLSEISQWLWYRQDCSAAKDAIPNPKNTNPNRNRIPNRVNTNEKLKKYGTDRDSNLGHRRG